MEEQPLHCDLPPVGTAQILLAVSRVKEASWKNSQRCLRPPWPPEALVPFITSSRRRQQLSRADISSVKDTLATYIRRVYLGKLPRDEAQALEADWSRRSCGVRELASRLLLRWPVVQQEAANHVSLIELASIYPPKGKQLGRLIGLDDAMLARHVFVGIVGFPDDIFAKLHHLHFFESDDESSRKRVKAPAAKHAASRAQPDAGARSGT
jgi:hypothetical protein